MNAPLPFASCPIPTSRYDRVMLGHGSGGRLSHELLTRVFLPAFSNPALAALEDQATVAAGESGRIALTTDSFVVSPLFFPGGDIGKLAVYGTVNDLAVGGAEPRYLTASFILEEGLAISELERVVTSMREACLIAGVTLVAGDTKVVGRGKADGVFITTTGVGIVPRETRLTISSAQPGDKVIVSGTIGDHGVAIMSVRQGISFETELRSDCAPLTELCQAILRAAPQTRCMRDPTRGGVASALNEIAAASNMGMVIDEEALPLRPEVQGACEMLGLDPLHVANEGKLVAVVPQDQADAALEAVRSHPLGAEASIIGSIAQGPARMVRLRSAVGGERLVALLAGEQLPRIC